MRRATARMIRQGQWLDELESMEQKNRRNAALWPPRPAFPVDGAGNPPEQLIFDRPVAGSSELARLGGAGLTQLMNLLNLAEVTEGTVLFLFCVATGPNPIIEHPHEPT